MLASLMILSGTLPIALVFEKTLNLFKYRLLELGACHVPQGKNLNTSQYRSAVALKLDLPAKDR